MTTRREFIGMAAATMAATMVARPALAQRHVPLGLQLYTVRDDLAKDFTGTLTKIKAIGIRKVQTGGLTANGHDALQLRKIFGDLGLTWESSHTGGDELRVSAQQTIDRAKAAGLKNLVCSFPPYPEDQRAVLAGPTLDDWKRDAETCNRVGALCQKAGLAFSYHNHNVEFKKLNGAYAYDTLLKELDPALVQMEMDIGWVTAGGADPVDYLTRFPTRYHSLHIKDLKPQGIPNTEGKMTSAIIGKGIVDWARVLPAARKASVQSAYLELEEPYDPSPLEMVRASYEYLKGQI
jgi:sugar phosphate isomerase/epimerase